MTDSLAATNPLFERWILDQTTWDSGLLTGLGMIVHRLDSPGDYAVSVLRDERIVRHIPLSVIRESPQRPLPPKHDVDLGKPARRPERREVVDVDDPMTVPVNGLLTFTATSERAGHAVIIARATGDRPREVSGEQATGGEEAQAQAAVRFDSRRLGPEDVYAVTLLRPGVYSMTNVHTRASGTIRMAYPEVGKQPYSPPEPATVLCLPNAFEPARVELQPAQGIVFNFRVPSRIRIEFREPIESPQPRERRTTRASWRKPRTGEESAGSQATQDAQGGDAPQNAKE